MALSGSTHIKVCVHQIKTHFKVLPRWRNLCQVFFFPAKKLWGFTHSPSSPPCGTGAALVPQCVHCRLRCTFGSQHQRDSALQSPHSFSLLSGCWNSPSLCHEHLRLVMHCGQMFVFPLSPPLHSLHPLKCWKVKLCVLPQTFDSASFSVKNMSSYKCLASSTLLAALSASSFPAFPSCCSPVFSSPSRSPPLSPPSSQIPDLSRCIGACASSSCSTQHTLPQVQTVWFYGSTTGHFVVCAAVRVNEPGHYSPLLCLENSCHSFKVTSAEWYLKEPREEQNKKKIT